ncbi:GLPGLI family protein [Cellulophaga lytica]|uniref:GLPGLI family protein n=1 Tax=Cellulophaga lytica TaxID=979 RepID=UPI000B68953D|nr:GLPGLI family protein [Cellulophaga lytica]SNQ42723.1 conserved exported hypothetical protein [Cellulophaga lytica]
MKQNRIKITTLILLLIVSNFCWAQKLEGTVKYEGSLNKTYIDSILKTIYNNKNIPHAHKEFAKNEYGSAVDVDYYLHFKNNQSYFYYNDALELETGHNPTSSLIGKMPFYRNIKANNIIEINQYVGTINRKPLQWKITNKTKKIGKYVCNQALATETLFSRQGHYYTEKIEAWFTTEIPVSIGPKLYTGLPGLVLKVKTDKFTMTATEINLNPKKEISITVPNLNKIITQEQANKKWEELAEASKQNN